MQVPTQQKSHRQRSAHKHWSTSKTKTTRSTSGQKREPEEDALELDPVKRLDDGEELAIRLHTPFVGDNITLIDGKPYMPLGGPSDDDDEEDEPREDDEYDEFPNEMSFYALGVKRDGDNLRIRPVGMNECRNPGGVFHRSGIAEFPASFMARIVMYLDSLK